MPRIPYPSPDDLSEYQRKALGDMPANVTRMMVQASESVFKGFSKFGQGLLIESSLQPTIRELAILRVGYLSGSTYETFQHESLGRHVGLSDAEIDAIREGDCESGVLDEKQCAVLRFVDDLVVNVKASDETLAEVRKHFSDTQVIDLILVSGAYMMVSRFLETTGVEIDEGPIDWSGYPKDD